MRFSFQRSQLEKIFAQRNGYMMLALGSLLLCVLQMLIIFFLIGREKIIIIPPNIEKSFWVSAQNVSPDYLTEMTIYFAYLRLNITPESASFQRESILRYTDPASYSILKAQLVQDADRISEQNISMAFFPTKDMKVDIKHFKAIIEGDLKSYVGDTPLPSKHVSYLITYRYNSGHLFIKSFEEVKHE